MVVHRVAGGSVQRRSAMVACCLALLLLAVTFPTAGSAETDSAGPTTQGVIDTLPRPEVDGADNAMIASVTRLYLAVFGRMPDPVGHRYWVAQRLAGMSADDVADEFMASTEWSERYGTIGNAGFVDLLYRHVLHRVPDAVGSQYWRSRLDHSTARRQVLLQFSDSNEFVDRTGTERPPLPPPHPPAPDGSGDGRRIVYHNSEQRVWLVEADGTIHDSYPVSGRRNTPRPGMYSVFSKSPKAWAGHNGITMNHMVRFARGRSLAIGFHSIPIRPGGIPLQSVAALGSYQSAGCVRQSEHKARDLYEWADLGTTVVVLG
ncbi:MAG: DUF4214 domain-containing protein [Acidimicrobiales bacterium]